MAATGTGLAPLIPLIQSVLNNPNDETGLYLIYACAAENDYGRKLLDDVIAAGSGSGKQQQLTVEYKVRGTPDSRVNLASIEGAIEGLTKAGKLLTGEASSKIQVHLSGAPPFVKGLHAQVAGSKKLKLASRSLQLVSWGYTDR
jgi:NAD(P)H-flavin reductase